MKSNVLTKPEHLKISISTFSGGFLHKEYAHIYLKTGVCVYLWWFVFVYKCIYLITGFHSFTHSCSL